MPKTIPIKSGRDLVISTKSIPYPSLHIEVVIAYNGKRMEGILRGNEIKFVNDYTNSNHNYNKQLLGKNKIIRLILQQYLNRQTTLNF